MSSAPKRKGTYTRIIEKIFLDRYREDATEIPFERADIPDAAVALGLPVPKNLGDVVYSKRFRQPMPQSVLDTQPEGLEWIIEGRGSASYVFRLARVALISPNPNRVAIKIPDATPEIVSAYALSDEQALLARIRYNRLIDMFLGLAAYSLQNHLRTSVKGVGQIEIDEVYVGVNRDGRQYVIPVQAKGGNDKLSSVQTKQDILCCTEKYPALECQSVSAQFVSDDLIALFQLAIEDGDVKIVEERHYKLVPADEIDPRDIQNIRFDSSIV